MINHSGHLIEHLSVIQSKIFSKTKKNLF